MPDIGPDQHNVRIDPLWTGDQIALSTGGDLLSAFEVYGVAIDSRDVRRGDLFIALKGDNQDGHAYLKAAFENGAVAALISDRSQLPGGYPAVVVDDTFKALEALGRTARERLTGRVIGVTGSVGKTGTKNALLAALTPSGPTYASERSFNNHYGVPLTLARTPPTSRFVVLEMGMNHPGELRALSAIARPDIAIITTVEAVHMAHFDSIEQIADAKAEIMEGLSSALAPGGVAILNRDNSQFDRLAGKAAEAGVGRVITFGEHETVNTRLVKKALHDDCSTVIADLDGVLVTYKIGVPGAHWVKNSLAVMAAVAAVEGDLGLAGLALADMRAPRGRGRRHLVSMPDGNVLLIDESYNASPVAGRAAIAELARIDIPRNRGRRIVVLGDMLELGAEAQALHAGLAEQITEANVDIVVGVGEIVPALLEALPHYVTTFHAANAAQAVDQVTDLVQPGDAIMVKGSNAVGLSRVVDALLVLNERSTARAGSSSATSVSMT